MSLIFLGVAFLAGGTLGLYNLRGTGGTGARLLRIYPALAVLSGVGLVYASLRPKYSNRIVTTILGGAAFVVVASSVYAAVVGYAASGELAPFFVALGFVGSFVGLLLGALAWELLRSS